MKRIPPRHFFLWLAANMEHPINGTDDEKFAGVVPRYNPLPDAIKMRWVKEYHRSLLTHDDEVMETRAEEMEKFIRFEEKQTAPAPQKLKMRTPECLISEH